MSDSSLRCQLTAPTLCRKRCPNHTVCDEPAHPRARHLRPRQVLIHTVLFWPVIPVSDTDELLPCHIICSQRCCRDAADTLPPSTVRMCVSRHNARLAEGRNKGGTQSAKVDAMSRVVATIPSVSVRNSKSGKSST